MLIIYNMLSINGTTNYSTARIDGVIFTDTSAEIEKIKEDITGITYNDITDTTNIDNNVAISFDLSIGGNATVSGTLNADTLNLNNLNVSNNISTNTLDASSNITTKGDLMIYDKRATPIPYKWETDISNHLKLTYQPSATEYTLFDATVDGFDISHLTLPRLTTFSSGLFLPSTKYIYWDDVGNGGYITYNATTASMQIDSGISGSGTSTYISVRNGAGSQYSIDFNSSRLKIPVKMELTGNHDLVFDAGSGKIDQTNSTGTNVLDAVTIKADNDLTQSGTGVITQSGTGVNTMKSITLTDDSTIIMSGTGTIRQSGTQENYLKDTNLTEVKSEKTLLGYETDEFINKDTALRRYYPFDTQLGTGNRFNNFNRYFVDGTYPASSMTNTGTQTNNNYVGQIGNSCFEFTNGRYFFDYGSSALYYDTNYMSFGGWVYVSTTATGCRPFFTQTTQSGSYLVLIGVNNTLTLNGDASGYFKGVTVLGSNANNAWVHIFVVIEGTTQKTYRNGTLIDTQTRTLFPTTGEATFGMGVEALSDSSRVDDLRIYSRVLTADEVAAVYRYRGALREDYQTKIHGTTLVGDRADGSYSTRQFNVRSQDGIISIGRYSGSQPGFELLNFNPDTAALRSTALFLGGGATDYATLLLRTGGDVFVYYAYRDLFDIIVSARVRGANLRVDGNITQPSTTTTNEMAGITMYQNQSLTQSGSGIITQTNTVSPTPITGINANTYTYYGTWIASGSSVVSGGLSYWNAFDNNTNTFWPCVANRYSNGVYTGTTSTTISGVGAVLGEWLQIQMPYSFALTQYTLQQRTGLGMRMPRIFYIVGSTDGTTWVQVDYRTYTDNTTGLTTLTNTVSGSGTYNYYRLITNAVYQGTNGNYVEMVEWKMTGTIGGTNQLKSTNIIGDLSVTGGSTITDLSCNNIYFGDGTVLNTVAPRAMQTLDDMEFYTSLGRVTGYTGTYKPKIATFDPNACSWTQSAQAVYLCQIGVVRINKGETYTGIATRTGNSRAVRVAMYDVGANAARLAYRATNYTMPTNGFNFIPFDTPYTSPATKFVAIMLVPMTGDLDTTTFNHGQINWNYTPSPSTALNVLSGYATPPGLPGSPFPDFPATWNLTVNTSGAKYYLALY